jgi:hypothetical protein
MCGGKAKNAHDVVLYEEALAIFESRLSLVRELQAAYPDL